MPAPATHPTIVPADAPVLAGRSATYTVSGAGVRTGSYSLTGGQITLKQAIVSASLVRDANIHGVRVKLVRRTNTGEQTRATVEIEDLFAGRVADYFLQDGDQIIVESK